MTTLSHSRVHERGILTSTYKQEIRKNVSSMRSQSLLGFKNRIKSNSDATCCSLATTLRVSLFFIAMVLIF